MFGQDVMELLCKDFFHGGENEGEKKKAGGHHMCPVWRVGMEAGCHHFFVFGEQCTELRFLFCCLFVFWLIHRRLMFCWQEGSMAGRIDGRKDCFFLCG